MIKKSDYISDLTDEIFESFKETLKKAQTAREYYYVICQFCTMMEKDFLSAGKADFEAYRDNLYAMAACNDLSYKTVYYRISVIKKFSSYILQEAEKFGLKSYTDHAANIRRPAVPIDVSPRTIPQKSDFARIRETAKPDPLMNAVIALVTKCALTSEEIINLQTGHFVIDINGNYGLKFVYADRPNRYLKIPQDVLEAVNGWRNVDKVDDGYIFHNKKRGRLSQRTLQIYVQKLMEKTFPERDKDKLFTIQDLRNMAVVLMLRGGAESGDVANYIGISTSWMHRYSHAVEAFANAPCDFI